MIEPGRWGNKRRLSVCLEYLRRYGVHAKEVLPQLREMRRDMGEPSERTALLDKGIADIEASKDSPKLVALKDFTDSRTMRNAR